MAMGVGDGRPLHDRRRRPGAHRSSRRGRGSSGSSDLVEMRPFVADRVALARLYREAACVVAPGPHETFGLAVLEAAASGARVVACSSTPAASAVGVARQHVHGKGSSADLVRAVDRALGDAARSRRGGRAWDGDELGARIRVRAGRLPAPLSVGARSADGASSACGRARTRCWPATGETGTSPTARRTRLPARRRRATATSGTGTPASTRSCGVTSAPSGRVRSSARCVRAGRLDGFIPHTAFWHDSAGWRRAPFYATHSMRGNRTTAHIQTPAARARLGARGGALRRRSGVRDRGARRAAAALRLARAPPRPGPRRADLDHPPRRVRA